MLVLPGIGTGKLRLKYIYRASQTRTEATKKMV